MFSAKHAFAMVPNNKYLHNYNDLVWQYLLPSG